MTAEAASPALLDVFTTAASALETSVVRCDLPVLRETLIAESLPHESIGITQEVRAALPVVEGLHRTDDTWPLVAVGRAMFGIAATGSVAVAEANHHDRLTTLLCQRHVVLLPAGAIAPTMMDTAGLMRGWLGEGLGRYVTFISGPSRTSDIERVLTLGVHGPRELTVVLVEGWEPYGA